MGTRYVSFPIIVFLPRKLLTGEGLTVGVLVTSAIVAGTTSKEGKPVERIDHSWEDILGTYPVLCSLTHRAQENEANVMGAEAEGQMKHEDRMEVQQGKIDRRKAEAEAKKNNAEGKA